MIFDENSESILISKDKDTNFVKWLLTDLHVNPVKKSFEAIETLISIAKDFPDIFIDYWNELGEFINIQFSINETKKTNSTLKIIERWISSISNICFNLQKQDQENDDFEENKNEVNNEISPELQAKLDYYNILNLEGCKELLNKYLMFFIKSNDMDVKITT